MNFLFFDIGLYLLVLFISNHSVFLAMYAFTVLEFPDFSCILTFRLSQKLKLSSETPMKFPLPVLQNFWSSLCFVSGLCCYKFLPCPNIETHADLLYCACSPLCCPSPPFQVCSSSNKLSFYFFLVTCPFHFPFHFFPLLR